MIWGSSCNTNPPDLGYKTCVFKAACPVWVSIAVCTLTKYGLIGIGFKVQGSRFEVQGSGFRVQGVLDRIAHRCKHTAVTKALQSQAFPHLPLSRGLIL